MATMTVSIAADLLQRLLDEAATSPRREVCGLLFGDGASIDHAEATANIADDPATSFEIDPRALIAALRRERMGGARRVGHYHSHPSGVAEPSAHDRAAAEPGLLWLILADQAARLWLADLTGFREVPLVRV